MRTSAIFGVGLLITLVGSWAAFGAGDAPGRYVMHPAEGGGFVRLDTETRVVSLCSRGGAQWSCTAIADSGSGPAEELDRLRAENKNLKEEVKRLEDMVLADGGRNGRAERRLELPSEEDVDKALSYLERIFRKFRDKLKDFESQDRRGTPL